MLARRWRGAASDAPARPAADRGSRTRRSTGRTRTAPRCGTRASGRAASGSASDPSPRSGVRTVTVPSSSFQKLRASRERRIRRRAGSLKRSTSARASATSSTSPSRPKTTRSLRRAELDRRPGSRRTDRGRRRRGSESSARAIAAGCASEPLRPMNSVRSPVRFAPALPRTRDRETATRSANSWRKRLRRDTAPVAGSVAVTTWMALRERFSRAPIRRRA